MKRNRFHAGSALLIVLGMLAFMTVSAIAFSAFMRSSRLPSSYLRRTIGSRMLVKAALAEAIDEIDAAIGDHPHPNVWKNQAFDNSNNRDSSVVRLPEWGVDRGVYHNMNAWLGRVYLGGTNDTARIQDRLIEQYETVPVLSLEALAYIPPPLVNDARYYSRHTRSATWHSMGFDAGRYAFCALDVSDFFDINTLTADTPRSTNPNQRISLNYLFEGVDHSSAATGASAWDSFVGDIIDSKVPFVSLADWNLAIGSSGSTTFGGISPSFFYNYAKKGSTIKDFYSGLAETPEQKDTIARMSFVTDGWFPPKPNSGNQDEIDLADDDNQPFSKSDLEGTVSDFVTDVMLKNEGNKFWTRGQEVMGKLSKCALWDYLDKDDVPLSLAIPTLERTPMICGLSPIAANASTLKVEGSRDGDYKVEWVGDPQPGGKCKVTQYKVKYTVSGFPDVNLQALTVFPFRNKIPNENSYEIGGRIALFLSESGKEVKLRTSGSDVLNLKHQGGISVSAAQTIDNAVILMPLTGSISQPNSYDGAANGEDAAVKSIPLRAASKVPPSVTFLTATYEWETVDTHTKDDWPEGGNVDPRPQATVPDISGGAKVTEAVCNLKPLNADGEVSATYDSDLVTTLGNSGFESKLKLNLAAWVWIKNSQSGKIVDLVPACVQDDNDLNNLNGGQALKVGRLIGGSAYPLMRFDLGDGRQSLISFKSAGCASQTPGVVAAGDTANVKVVPQTVYVGDPRFNYAPESWFYVNDTASMSESDWLSKCGARGSNDNRRDGDIFMMTSDQCVLQSIYECANLPRVEDGFYVSGSSKTMQGLCVDPTSSDIQIRQAESGIDAKLVNANLMWRTYDPFPNSYLDAGDNFNDAGIVNSGGGYKINPFTDSTNIMMAAFANTPLEWRFAADPDKKTTGSSLSDKATTFNSQYAWNDYSQNGKIAYDDLVTLAGNFMEDIRSQDGIDIKNLDKAWQSAFKTLGWNNADKKANGTAWKYLTCDPNSEIELEETSNQGRIYNCDRKFLYGFWHDCFAARQQLFLIFVRAEPMLMGGDKVNSVPPQLGARAVALVWRDPERRDGVNQTDNRGVPPHRTRVLFYRQLE